MTPRTLLTLLGFTFLTLATSTVHADGVLVLVSLEEGGKTSAWWVDAAKNEALKGKLASAME